MQNLKSSRTKVNQHWWLYSYHWCLYNQHWWLHNQSCWLTFIGALHNFYLSLPSVYVWLFIMFLSLLLQLFCAYLSANLCFSFHLSQSGLNLQYYSLLWAWKEKPHLSPPFTHFYSVFVVICWLLVKYASCCIFPPFTLFMMSGVKGCERLWKVRTNLSR